MSQPLWSKTTLAQAVGLTVASAATATEALAQETTHLRITSSKQMFEFDELTNLKYPGDNGEADASDSLYVDLTIPVAPAWDVRLSVKSSEADGQNGGFSYPISKYASAHFKSSLSLDSEVIDFEAGHHMKLGQQDVRLFGGLRYMDLESDAKSTSGYAVFGSKYIGIYNSTRKSDLEAYGVRTGAETSIPLSKGLSLNGLAAVSAVHGTRENTGQYSYAKYNASYDYEDDNHTWFGAELEASVTWDPSPESDSGPLLSLGYSWNQTYDILNTSVTSSFSEESDLTETALFARIDFAL